MKITKLHVEGYRSFKDVTWKPGDLNVVIGPNASGKSNLLKLLEFLISAANGKLASHIQNEGGISSLVWDGIVPDIKIDVFFDIFNKVNQSLNFYLYLQNKQFFNEYIIKKELLREINATNPSKNDYTIYLRDAETFLYLDNEIKIRSDEIFLSDNNSYKSDDLHEKIYEQIRIQLLLELLFSKVFYDIHTERNAPIRRPIVTRYTKELDSNGQNLINFLHTLYTEDRTFKNNINEAMNAAFGDEFEEIIFTPAADNYIQMRIRWRSLQREQPSADLSDGTLRFLYLLAILANPDPHRLIAIDEPETGLHPRMFPIIAEFAREASSKSQVIFTTHSPDFLHAFRDPVTTTVVDWKEGQTQLRVLSDDELSYWLKEYTLGDLFRSGELEAMG